MLTFDENQWRALQNCDARQFVATACDQFLANRPELVTAPGREVVLGRMQAAHDYAEHVGLTSKSKKFRSGRFTSESPASKTRSKAIFRHWFGIGGTM